MATEADTLYLIIDREGVEIGIGTADEIVELKASGYVPADAIVTAA